MKGRRFTEWLRSRSDAQLRALVTARPELITPVPADIESLATRAAGPSALSRALDRLDRFTLGVLETLLIRPDLLTPAAAEPFPGFDPAWTSAVEAALDRLRELALIYDPAECAPNTEASGFETGRGLLPAPGVHEALNAPAGLGPPAAEVFRHHPPEQIEAVLAGIDPGQSSRQHAESPLERLAALLADPATVARLVDEVSPQARAALDELVWGPASGRLPNARREVTAATAHTPVEQLLARGLLGATGEDVVTLPREVALCLRGGRVHRDLSPCPPEPTGPVHDPALADRTAAGQAFTFTSAVEELCEWWGSRPPAVLRTGGLAVRDLKRTARFLDVPDRVAGLVVEVAHAAHLIAAGDGEWLPTAAYDRWRVCATEDRWAALASAWAGMERVPGLIGERDERDRPLNALHPGLRRVGAARVRAQVLAVLSAAAPGVAPTGRSVLARLAWERPRRPANHRLVEFTLREAEHLGVTGLGVLSAHGAAIGRHAAGDAGPAGSSGPEEPGGAAAAAELLAPLLPRPVDHVVLQADLTAMAPGPLVTDLRHQLTLMADVESKGGATVYRFGETSIRRALDAGRSADELIAVLERHSATPVPQPLRYLVTDVARRHGRIRVGTASAYVRCDDPGVLDEVLADRRSGPLRLRRLAPTVLASQTSRAVLVDSLRAMGYAPVAESADGDLLVTRAEARRTEATPVTHARTVTGPDADMVAAAVRAVRAGDEARLAHRPTARAPDGDLPRTPSSTTIEALREAIRQGTRVWIGYLDSRGHPTSRILEPARMEGGYLTAYDETRATVHRFALHRITGIADIN